MDAHGVPVDVLDGWAVAAAPPGVLRKALLGHPRKVPEGVEHLATLDGVPDGSIHDLMVYGVVERAADLIGLWRSIDRVLAVGGTARVFGVYWAHQDLHADPTRLRGLSERMFSYLSKEGRTALLADLYEDDVAVAALDGVNLEVVSMVHMGEPEWNGRSEEARSWAVRHYGNVVRRLDVVLRKAAAT